jgi:IS30 family transposase
VNQGTSNSEACRVVGVNRRTGTRWRYGRTVTTTSGEVRAYRPVEDGVATVEGSDRYLSQEDRFVIADGLRAKNSMTDIAASIGRATSTVTREVERNSDPQTGNYRPSQANRKAAQRRARPKDRKLAANAELCEWVQDGLEQRWSPEQISERLVTDFPDRFDMRIAPETIYQSLYNAEETGLRRGLARKLRTGRTHRRRHRRSDQRRTRFVDPMLLISERPYEINQRDTVGHWEGDLIVGALNQSAIGTLVERLTRYTLLVHMEGRSNAETFAASLTATYEALPEWLRKSLTWDQGVEMAGHASFTETSGISVYFCDPRSPWQRGTNENTNGLLRQYFPKHTDLGTYTAADLRAVERELNRRPRKVLGWQSPAERIDTLTQTHGVATTP